MVQPMAIMPAAHRRPYFSRAQGWFANGTASRMWSRWLRTVFYGAKSGIAPSPPSRAFTYDLTHRMKSIALYLDASASPRAVVAAADIGYLAFYGNRRVLDLGGLVEPRTGELRSEYSYEEIVARGSEIPGLVNLHSHTAMTLLRGTLLGTDGPLQRY